MKKSASKPKAPSTPKGVDVVQVVEVAKHATGPKPGARGRYHGDGFGAWTPSECHMAWYYLWAVQHRGFQEIAKEVGVSRAAVCKAVRRVEEFMRLETFGEILETRHRQTATLENMVAELLRAWHKSKEIGAGDPSYLGEARAAMADIRKIWGVDKPLKLEVSGGNQGEGLERICGLTPAEALKNQARAMLERAEKLEVNSA